MEYRPLGRTELQVSTLGFGCGSIGGLFVRGASHDQRVAVERAVAAGVNYFDTAPLYGNGQSEENLGRVLREVRPPNVHVGTKVGLTRDELADAPAAIRRSLEASLRRLGRDSVDLFQLHNRVTLTATDGDRVATVAEVLGPIAAGLRAVRAAGLTRFIGFTGLGETGALHQVAKAGVFDTVQCYYNILNPTGGLAHRVALARAGTDATQDFAGLVDAAANAGLGVIAIRIFAAGAVTARDDRHPIAGDPGRPLAGGADYRADVDRARALLPSVAELGLEGPEELALRFVLAHPRLSTALTGVSDLDQLDQVLRWASRGPLDPRAIERISS